jgi:outer membrane receptor protein involved in Fe transport
LLGLANHAALGASFDGSETNFGAISFIGGITPGTRVFIGPGEIIDEPGDNQPVSVRVDDAYYGVFATDTLNLTPALALTLSGRFNDAEIDLHDRLGGDLSGDHGYARFNPAAGLSWRAFSFATVYAGYAEANRAPTPAELSCASPADSCSLANFFVGDPNLKQVTARTVEAGVRGRFTPFANASLRYDVSLYRSDIADDIAFINSPTLGRAYFTNIGGTRRQGVDASAELGTGPWTASVAWSHTDATYRTGFVESSGSNPEADANGDLTIMPGNRLPGVPAEQVKLNLSYKVTDRLTLGLNGIGQSGQPLFGDEANRTPKLAGFFVLNLDATYQLLDRLALFVRVENATDQRYSTFGTFSPTTSVFLAQAPNATNPRADSPAAPAGAFGGVRFRF